MTIDILPTLAELIEAPANPNPIDGKSIWPLMTGESEEMVQEAYYFYYHQNQLHSLRSGKWKMYFPHRYRSMKGQELGIDGMPGKYTHFTIEEIELYDLELDIGEQNNVAADFPEVVKTLSTLADSARTDMGDSLMEVEGANVREPGRL